jgi:hypothetical protein
MGRKIVRILVVGALIVAGAFALNEAGDRSAIATNQAPAPRLRSARGLGVSMKLTDYTTGQKLGCGGTYKIESWVFGVVRGTARTTGTARLQYRTAENGSKDWITNASPVFLKRGSQVIGELDQWPDPGGDAEKYTFRVELFRKDGPGKQPQASLRCTVTISRTPD